MKSLKPTIHLDRISDSVKQTLAPNVLLTNTTLYNSSDLVSLLADLPLFQPDITDEDIDDLQLSIKYCQNRKGWTLKTEMPYGRAYLNEKQMFLYLPRPCPTFNKPLLVQLFYHELLHTKGLLHHQMNLVQHIKDGYDQFFWANSYPLSFGRKTQSADYTADYYDVAFLSYSTPKSVDNNIDGIFDSVKPNTQRVFNIEVNMMEYMVRNLAPMIGYDVNLQYLTASIDQHKPTLSNGHWQNQAVEEHRTFNDLYSMYVFFLTKVYSSTTEEAEV